MEVIIVVLLCAIVFVFYLLYATKKEVLALKENICKQENELVQLKKTLREHENKLRRLSLEEIKSPSADKRFVKVIFTPDSKKCYDYLLGNNRDIKIGDFVEVYVNDKERGKPTWSVAKVVYISKTGEFSEHAKSKIKKKTDRPKW